MIIKSSKHDLKFDDIPQSNITEQAAIKENDVKKEAAQFLNNKNNQKIKKKKCIPAPVVEELVIEAVEEKIEDEDEDLSKWLETHMED